jgi:hypothetical protein
LLPADVMEELKLLAQSASAHTMVCALAECASNFNSSMTPPGSNLGEYYQKL